MSYSSNTLIVDCDGVLADKEHGGDYAKAGPLQYGIDQINALYDMGFTITLYTARYGDRECGNINRQYARGYVEWINWLDKNGVKYHNAWMGKPAGVMYIDDKAARVDGDDEAGWKQIWDEIGNLKTKDKYGNKM